MPGISESVAAVLRRSKIESDRLILPQEQLDRKLYEGVNKVIEALGGKWNRKERAHIFKGDPREKIAEALGDGTYTDAKKKFQFFETPDALARRMVEMAGIKPGMSVLEPSAGRGAVLKHLIATGASCYCCELNPDLIPEINIGAKFLMGDFLALGCSLFDRVVANPPFTKGQDIDHISHMYNLLAPGGMIVTISSPSWEFNRANKYARFRGWFEELEALGLATRETLPEGTFRESGTNVRALLLTIKR